MGSWVIALVVGNIAAMLVAIALIAVTRTYQFECEYFDANTKGEIQSRQMIKGNYVVKSDHEASWRQVSIASAQGESEFGQPTEQTFMDGFSYDPSNTSAMFTPDFFKGFPAMAVQAKNLVWDTDMFFQFAKHAKETKLGVPIKFQSGDVNLGGSGTFTNKDVELTKLGSARLHGIECEVIKYDAFFNSVKLDLPGDIHLVGRSHYWGEFYVRAKTADFESGTLYEDVLGELNLPSGPQTISVFRKGTLERTS